MTTVPKIKITLKSDLCSGSGQGFSGIIDTDVCHDKYGLPYIPARRLKGVLLDAAGYINICCKTKNQIFGVRGDIKSGSLRLGNAKIGCHKCYKGFREDLKNSNLNSQKVLALFTDTKAQTAIEDDTADEDSLRFTRTVNQYSPLDGNEVRFFAECEIGGKYIEEFKKICKAVRNIGIERTRGLGAVRVELVMDDIKEKKKRENCIQDAKNKLDELDSSQKYRLNYDIVLNAPLMLPGVSNGETAEYISGTAILGTLAAEYLKSNKDENGFEDLFLKENVIIGNAYLRCSIPAPLFVQKIKETDDIRTIFSKEEPNGTPKPLKDAYIRPNSFKKFDVETEISYHHSRGDDSTLYTQKHLSAEQIFRGEIIGKGKYVKEIAKLLSNGIKLGRSKSAEYSECAIENIAPKTDGREINLINGESYVLALEADFVALDEYGNYSTDAGAILKETGITGKIKEEKTFIAVRRNAGYNILWNLKKPHFVSIKAGSYITFEYTGENKNFDFMEYYGEKNNEGFGKVKIYKLTDLENFKFEKIANNPNIPESDKVSPQYVTLKEKIAKNDEDEQVRLRAIEFARGKRKILTGLNAAFVGRAALMVSQAKNFADLKDRVASIKTLSKKEEIERIIEEAGKIEAKLSENYEIFLPVVFSLAKYWLKNDEKDAKKESAAE